MAIKVIIGEQEPQRNKPFPKLMKYRYSEDSYVIALMESKSKGTVIYVCYNREKTMSGDKISNIWSDVNTLDKGWSDYNDPITLQNEA